MAFSSDLANELAYLYPDKIIVVGRIKDGEIKVSFRSSDVILPPIIEKALAGCEGFGGGHEHASGGNIKADDFDQFMHNFRGLLD
jgi:oligoribonuclease NrnB/cAMP/cGMP phosphodiesterase (DHH superfamily)